MTPLAVSFLVLKATLLFAGGLAALRTNRAAAPALRHLMCLLPLAAALLLPLTLIETRPAIPIRIAALSVRPAVPAQHAGSMNIGALIYGIWLTGALFLLLRLAAGHWRLHRIARQAQKIDTHEGIPVLSAAVEVPLVTGVRRPAILMPAAAAGWEAGHCEAAIRHEWAHVERRDLLTNLIAAAACAVWWFHPLAWLLAAKQRVEQEAACDDAVIARGFDASSYAAALLAAAISPFRFATLGSPMFTKNDVYRRIQRLADHQPARPLSPAILRRMALGFGAIMIAIALLGPAAAQNAPYKVGGDVISPRLVEKVDPTYPPDAKDEKVEGTVLLNVVILPSGIAGEISVEKSLDARVDEAAIAAVRQWKFAPGTLKGEPVPVQARIEINFHLK
jgi:TonB family protein